MVFGGKDWTTTEFGAIMQWLPIETPSKTAQPTPIQTSVPITIPFDVLSCFTIGIFKLS